MPAFERASRGRLVDLGAEILDRVDAAVLVVDLDGIVLYANQYCAHLYGRGPDELLGDEPARFSIEPISELSSGVIGSIE